MKGAMNNVRFADPLAAILIVAVAFGVAVTPVLQASPHNVPISLLSLNMGVQTPTGFVNAGDKLIDTIADSATDNESEPVIDRTVFHSEKQQPPFGPYL